MITKRDFELLMFVGEMGAIPFDALQKLLVIHEADKEELSYRQTLRVLKRWEAMGMVESQKLVAWNRSWIWLTRAGLDALEMPYRAGNPVPLTQLRHQQMVVDLVIRLWRKFGNRVRGWKGDRSLRGTDDLYPDILCEMWFKELGWQPVIMDVELSRKNIDEKMLRLSNQYKEYWWFVVDKTRSTVLAARDRTGAAVVIYEFDTLQVCREA